MRFFVKNLSLRTVGYVMLGMSASSVSLLGGNSVSTAAIREPLVATTPPQHAQDTATSHTSAREMGTIDYYWTLGLINLLRWCKTDEEILLWALKQPREAMQAYIHVLLDGNPQRQGLANITNQDRSTPLHQAAKLGDAAIAHTLLEANANYFARDNRRATPLHVAAQYGAPLGLIYLLCADLENNKLREYLDARDIAHKTALLLASQYHHPDLVRQFVEMGADTQAVDKYGQNALHLAINPAVGTKKDRRNRRKALSTEAEACISILSDYLDIHCVNRDEHSLWDMTQRNNAARQVVHRLIEQRQSKLGEALVHAIPHVPTDLRELIIKFEGSEISVQEG